MNQSVSVSVLNQICICLYCISICCVYSIIYGISHRLDLNIMGRLGVVEAKHSLPPPQIPALCWALQQTQLAMLGGKLLRIK